MSSTNLKEAKMLDECIAAAIKDCASAIGRAVADGRSTCVHCNNFDEGQEVCMVATPPARPPARVIAFGCPGFVPGYPVPF